MRKPINSVSDYLKNIFGDKTVKLSIDGGFTCPNRDGSKGFGGCSFCSQEGSGDMASGCGNISESIDNQIALLSNKWPNARYLAYFQNHTNTYADIEYLKSTFEPALKDPRISGIVIGTRPDCLPHQVLDYLADLNRRTFMWVELGLQTIHEHTAHAINRGYPLQVYDEAMDKLNSLNIPVVTHLILGLPGESKKNMLDSVLYVCKKNTWGIKLHLLNIVEGSMMSRTHRNYLPFQSIEEYVNLVCDIIEIIPDNVVIHRMTGDAPRSILISPPWSYKKRSILNGIYNELKNRNTHQGAKSKL